MLTHGSLSEVVLLSRSEKGVPGPLAVAAVVVTIVVGLAGIYFNVWDRWFTENGGGESSTSETRIGDFAGSWSGLNVVDGGISGLSIRVMDRTSATLHGSWLGADGRPRELPETRLAFADGQLSGEVIMDSVRRKEVRLTVQNPDEIVALVTDCSVTQLAGRQCDTESRQVMRRRPGT